MASSYNGILFAFMEGSLPLAFYRQMNIKFRTWLTADVLAAPLLFALHAISISKCALNNHLASADASFGLASGIWQVLCDNPGPERFFGQTGGCLTGIRYFALLLLSAIAGTSIS